MLILLSQLSSKCQVGELPYEKRKKLSLDVE